MWTTSSSDSGTSQSRDSKLSAQTIVLYLLVLMTISQAFQITYSKLLSPLNKTSLIPAGFIQIHRETGFLFQGDERDYYLIAANLRNGRGYSASELDQPAEPTAYRPPLFPIILAVVFKVFGLSPAHGVRLSQLFIALLIPLSYWLGRSVCSVRCGIVAAAIVTLWPHGYYFGSRLLTEPLFAVLVVILFGLLLKLLSAPSYGLAVAAGLAAGGAILTRSGFAVTVALIALWLVLLDRQQLPWRIVLAFLGMMAVVLAPWSLRNYKVMNTPNPGTTGSGEVFAGAHNSETAKNRPGSWTDPRIWSLSAGMDRIDQLSEVERNAYFWNQGLAFLDGQPPETLMRLIAFKVMRFWIPAQRIVADEICLLCNVIASTLFLVPLFFSALGIWMLRNETAVFRLVVAFLGGATLLTVIFWGSLRFRMPLEPILWVFAAYAVTQLLGKRQSDQYPAHV